jgi:hypothetical protein
MKLVVSSSVVTLQRRRKKPAEDNEVEKDLNIFELPKNNVA